MEKLKKIDYSDKLNKQIMIKSFGRRALNVTNSNQTKILNTHVYNIHLYPINR